jgi:ompA family protein
LENKGHKKEESMVTITPAEEETAVPENDYYFISIHFGNDSDTPRADQTANLDAFVKAAKETGHTFKLVGRTDSNGSKEYNDDLAIRRVKKVADYAVDHGVDLSHLVGMYKGEEAPVDTNDTEAGRANNRRVDIFEHK